ncbi:MAG: porin [Proteobacteria bacterium]|nr:porin [Burkholderiales bacterium]MCA0309417.1 porin [Pseudomonadota bacterium]
MKKTTVTWILACSAMAALPVAARADQVTLFGTVDLAMTHLSNGGGSTTGMSHSGGNISRMGIRGAEDLGGGLGAGFWFESGLSGKDGSAGGPAGNFWNRRATVSLTGSFGELRLGRDDSATFLNTLIFDPFLTNGVAGTQSFVMNGAPIQISNAISYFLPKNLGGFYGQLQYAWGPASIPTSKAYRGFRAGYASGPLNLSLAAAALNFSGASKLKIVNVGASYDFGTIKPTLIWAQEKRDGGTSVRAIQIGATATFGAHLLRASIGDYRKSGGAADANWRKLGLGYAYNLSKRTMLYASAGFVSNGDGANRAVSAQGMAVPVNTLGHSASGYEIGLRHFF